MPQHYRSVISVTDHPRPVVIERLCFDCMEEVEAAYLILCQDSQAPDLETGMTLDVLRRHVEETERYREQSTSGEWLAVHPEVWDRMQRSFNAARVLADCAGLPAARALIAALPLAA